MAAETLLVFLALGLAMANGSNDVSKGIATLVGSGVTNIRAAALWGTAWTVAGGLTAAYVSRGLVATFSGSGFLQRAPEGSAFLGAVAAGAAAWVVFSSLTGLPVSTTHAIAGALAGAGIAAEGAGALHWGFLGEKVAIPLAASPLVSVALLYAVYPLLRRALGSVDRYCLCIGRTVQISSAGEGAAAFEAVGSQAVVGSEEECAAVPAITGRLNLVDGLHWMSAAATSLARGVNDTPKIVAVGIAASAIVGVPGNGFFAAVALAMGIGSLIGGLRVTETLARKVTPMSPTEGFSANLVTSLLVGAASFAALPVSTTHVSSGAIVGIGIHRGGRSIRWKTVRDMLLAWIVTLPAAAIAAGVVYRLVR
jgi:PiT family inorganic phosphate transporter